MKFHRIPVGPFATNCVLIEDEGTRKCIIVDPGGDGPTITDRIETMGILPTMVLLTHGHMDHCMEASNLAGRYDIPVAIHSADLPLYGKLEKQVEALLGKNAAASFSPGKPVEPTVFLEPGGKVAVGDVEADVIHLPGHSPGGIGLLFEGEPPVLICGDTIFRDGVGRTDLWGGDSEALLKSIRNTIFSMPDETRLITGHGAETTVGREKRSMAYLYL